MAVLGFLFQREPATSRSSWLFPTVNTVAVVPTDLTLPVGSGKNGLFWITASEVPVEVARLYCFA